MPDPIVTRLIPSPGCDQVSMGHPGDEIRLTQSFTWISTQKNPFPSVWDCINDAKVPKQGQRYTKDYSVEAQTAINTTSDQRYNYVCRNIEVAPVNGSPSAYTVKVTWSTRKPMDAQRQWFKITRSTGFRTAQAYRSGSTLFNGVPADGTVQYPPTSWAAGSKVDSNGTPLQFKIAQQSIQIDILWDRTADKSLNTSTNQYDSPDPPSTWTSDYCNKRNSVSFLGWPAGFVTYLGWTANESPDEWLVVSHRFLADDWQFLEQRPGPNASGKALLAAGPSWGSSPSLPTQSVANVAWYQPYIVLADFSDLFTWRANLWTAINTPKPVR